MFSETAIAPNQRAKITTTKTYKIKDLFDNAPKSKKDKVINKVKITSFEKKFES